MKGKRKIWYICGLFMILCLFYPGQKAAAAETQKMKVTLDSTEIGDDQFPEEYYQANHIAKEIGCDDTDYIRIISSQIVERELSVSYKAKMTFMPQTYSLADNITIPGYKKGDELKQQIEEALKAHLDRIEVIYEIGNVYANKITYEVSYQYFGPKITEAPTPTPTPKPSKSKMDLNAYAVYLNKGETFQLKLKNPPKKIQIMTWTSFDTKVAKVSKSGKVTAVNYGSTMLDLTVYAGGKYYNFSAYITVYKLNGFLYGETTMTLHRGEGTMEIGDVTAWLDIKGADYGITPCAIPYDKVKVEIKPTADNIAKVQEVTKVGSDGATYLSGFGIAAYRDGVVTITVSDNKNTCSMKITIGTGVSRLDPVEAVKKNDFTGYQGDELKTLQTVRAFFDQYNMYSESMSQADKISHIVDYFIATYKDERYIPYKHGPVYRTMIDGHGVCGDYSQTVCFLCDCLGIKNVEEVGLAGGEAHGWNKVEVDGKWYHIDAFWCANLKSKNKYYLSDDIWLDHVKTYENDYYNYGDIAYIGALF